MKKFSLLETLTVTDSTEEKRPKLTTGINYKEYTVPLFNTEEKTVYIPNRETENFEKALHETVVLTNDALRAIMRKHNGVTEI